MQRRGMQLRNNYRNVEIVSDGTPYGTRIVDARTGQSLNALVRGISFKAEAGELPEAVITVVAPNFRFSGRARVDNYTIQKELNFGK